MQDQYREEYKKYKFFKSCPTYVLPSYRDNSSS
ncbi:hypothetical protein EV294_102676 [Paenibacillus sp. BK033]|nr:hypothetical protein EV294_102676 [Paenibacillus sp. BK033]